MRSSIPLFAIRICKPSPAILEAARKRFAERPRSAATFKLSRRAGAGDIAAARRRVPRRNRHGARPGRLGRRRLHSQPERRRACSTAMPRTASTCGPAAARSISARLCTMPGLPATCYLCFVTLHRERRAPAFLVGFSLGGNVVMKLAGELGDDGSRADRRRLRRLDSARPGGLRAPHRRTPQPALRAALRAAHARAAVRHRPLSAARFPRSRSRDRN